MKKKVILIGPDAKREVLKGAQYAVNAVKLTIGPYGRNFASGIKGGPIAISNDGVSLLKEIEGINEIQDIGVRAVREAATKTNDVAGDGTTGSAVLTGAVLDVTDHDEGIIGAGRSTVGLIEQIKKEKDEIVKLLKESATPVETEEELVAIALVSGEYKELAKLIGKAQFVVGKEGAVLCEEHNKTTDEVEYINGIRMDNGFPTSRIINNPEKMCLEATDVPVILTNKVFHGGTWLAPIEKQLNDLILKGEKSVVIIGRGFDDDAIDLALKNIQKDNGLNIYPINAPYTWQDEVMEDLAAILGAKYFKGNEHNLKNLVAGDIGRASKVVCKRFETVIAGFKEGTDVSVDARVKERIEELEESLKGDISPFERRGRETRMSQMKHGTAVIYVGADTEQERRHKKDKVEDAINAVKWAHREGVVKGGGLALYELAETLPETYILKEAIKEPHLQIMRMAPSGFEIEEWVKDPVKVVYTALTNACDIAGSLATTEIAINFERDKKHFVTNVDNQIGEHPEEE